MLGTADRIRRRKMLVPAEAQLAGNLLSVFLSHTLFLTSIQGCPDSASQIHDRVLPNPASTGRRPSFETSIIVRADECRNGLGVKLSRNLVIALILQTIPVLDCLEYLYSVERPRSRARQQLLILELFRERHFLAHQSHQGRVSYRAPGWYPQGVPIPWCSNYSGKSLTRMLAPNLRRCRSARYIEPGSWLPVSLSSSTSFSLAHQVAGPVNGLTTRTNATSLAKHNMCNTISTHLIFSVSSTASALEDHCILPQTVDRYLTSSCSSSGRRSGHPPMPWLAGFQGTIPMSFRLPPWPHRYSTMSKYFCLYSHWNCLSTQAIGSSIPLLLS